jgi:drug/metabolite transporter (DMT)-like permease
MKIISRRFLMAIIALFGVISVFSAPAPPAPPIQQRTGPPVPPEEQLPIDQGLVFLIVAALIFGTYIIYKHKLKQKTPA